jgi:YD repeat-containing protein
MRMSVRYVRQFEEPTQSGCSYYLYDGHGSVRALADTSGNVTDTYDYDAFGNLIRHWPMLSRRVPTTTFTPANSSTPI